MDKGSLLMLSPRCLGDLMTRVRALTELPVAAMTEAGIVPLPDALIRTTKPLFELRRFVMTGVPGTVGNFTVGNIGNGRGSMSPAILMERFNDAGELSLHMVAREPWVAQLRSLPFSVHPMCWGACMVLGIDTFLQVDQQMFPLNPVKVMTDGHFLRLLFSLREP